MVFVKGHSGYKKKGTKHKETLLKEERRAIFEARISQKWEQTIDKLRPEYIADQFLGKPVERHEVNITNEPSEKVQKLIDEYTHKRGKTTTD